MCDTDDVYREAGEWTVLIDRSEVLIPTGERALMFRAQNRRHAVQAESLYLSRKHDHAMGNRYWYVAFGKQQDIAKVETMPPPLRGHPEAQRMRASGQAHPAEVDVQKAYRVRNWREYDDGARDTA